MKAQIGLPETRRVAQSCCCWEDYLTIYGFHYWMQLCMEMVVNLWGVWVLKNVCRDVDKFLAALSFPSFIHTQLLSWSLFSNLIFALKKACH